MNVIFNEIGVVIIVATAFALLSRFFKQPPLVGYILTGLTLGPLGAHFINNQELFNALKEIGIALLLFLVGLELDWNKAKHQLNTTFALGTLQVAGTFVVGFAIAYFLNLGVWAGIFTGTALAFSSTVIVVKLLSESHDLNSLHGRLSVGLLLIQDFVAITSLVVISGISTPTTLPLSALILLLSVKTVSFLALLRVLALFPLPQLFAKIAKSSELLFLSSLAWCFVVAIVAAYFDFPLEFGAFLAGVSLASLPYSLDILNRLRSLRDFFVILLFVTLGSTMQIPGLNYIFLTGILISITIIFKPIFSFLILVRRGYKSRTAFMAGLTQGQLSEFSLILVAIGLASGHLDPNLGGSIIFTLVISLLISSIALTHREQLYLRLRKILHAFENKKKNPPENTEDKSISNHVIIFGYHRMGYHILKKLRDIGHHEVLIVDFNPDIIRSLKKQKVESIYGDVQDEDILEQIKAEVASMIICTIPHREETLFLIDKLGKLRKKPILIVTAHQIDDALEYYKRGADYVILPHLLGGEHVAELITRYEKHSLVHFIKHRAQEVKLLRAKNNALYYD